MTARWFGNPAHGLQIGSRAEGNPRPSAARSARPVMTETGQVVPAEHSVFAYISGAQKLQRKPPSEMIQMIAKATSRSFQDGRRCSRPRGQAFADFASRAVNVEAMTANNAQMLITKVIGNALPSCSTPTMAAAPAATLN